MLYYIYIYIYAWLYSLLELNATEQRALAGGWASGNVDASVQKPVFGRIVCVYVCVRVRLETLTSSAHRCLEHRVLCV